MKKIKLHADLATFATERQAQVLNLMLENDEDSTKVAELLGVNAGTVRDTMSKLRKKAAAQGYYPEGDLNVKVPEGYHVRGTSTLYGSEGQVKQQWVKTQRDRDAEREAWLDYIKGFVEESRGKSEVTPAPKTETDDQLAVYGWGDMHVGMLAWGKEVGDDFNLDICEALYKKAAQRAVQAAPSCKQALIIAVGDNLHMNGSDWLTPKSKHMLDGDSRVQKVLRVGGRILRYQVDEALAKHEHVTLVVVLGNHDFDSSAGVALAVEWFYENNPRVTVDNTPGRYHYYRFGKNLIGITHGDTVKPDKLPLLMAARKPKDWGETEHRKWYTGHLHTEILRGYSGVTVETLATVSPKDAYAHEAGYDSARKTVVEVWDREFGKELRHDIGIARILRG